MKKIVLNIDFEHNEINSVYGECHCGAPGTDDHSCPYAADINNDSETLCNCCRVCENNCADDI